MKITLRIEKLIVEGFPGIHRERIAGIVRRELVRRLEAGDFASVCTEPLSVSCLDAGEFPLDPAANTESLGIRAAGAVHQALSRAASANTERSGHTGAVPATTSVQGPDNAGQT